MDDVLRTSWCAIVFLFGVGGVLSRYRVLNIAIYVVFCSTCCVLLETIMLYPNSFQFENSPCREPNNRLMARLN